MATTQQIWIAEINGQIISRGPDRDRVVGDHVDYCRANNIYPTVVDIYIEGHRGEPIIGSIGGGSFTVFAIEPKKA